ncbi:MAG: response regulator [Planctomycetota bacterium]
MNQGTATMLDTLRLSPRQIETLLDELQQPRAAESPAASNRESERFFFTELNGVPLDIVHPGGSDARFLVIPTDLSASGMGLLHGGFLHRATPVIATLTDLHGTPRRIEGHVTRCLLHAGRVHRIGVLWDDPIDVNDFLRFDDGDGEGEQAGGMTGQVLHLDDSPDFRRVFRHHCEKLGVTITEAENIDAAMAAVSENAFVLAYVDLHLEDEDGIGSVERLREAGYEGPVVLLSGDESVAVAERARAAGVAEVLFQPVQPDAIRESLARHLQAEAADEGPIFSSMWAQQDMRPIIMTTVGKLSERLGELSSMVACGGEDWRDYCRDLKSEAGACGFDDLAVMFRRVEAADASSAEAIEAAIGEVRALVTRIEAGIAAGG